MRTALAAQESWRLIARCRNADTSLMALFFHPEGERGHQRRRRQQAAKQVCAECPVLAECRAHSLAFEEPFGTWGGLTEDERGRLIPSRAARLRTHRSTSEAADAELQNDNEAD
ncbi:WhiB family transcriptional regulator [Mycolicibacterium conceptionense]|uniref:WhiB family transcriptional regulator n=1 Tax=Mycolicibacterium conceptionense TaxID=451644 RepID=UPI00096CD662|nr:WhiB family transcriptional regulator [Mycolicibacterium conceptionense]